MIRLSTLCCLVLCCFACGNDTPTVAEPEITAPVATANTLPALPVSELQKLYDQVDYIDYLFTTLPISMSQQTPNDVKAAVTHISDEAPAAMDPACKVTAQIFYEANGKTLRRADMYYGPSCTYLVWNENGKPAYASRLTGQGIQFFNSVLKNVQGGQ